MKKNDIRILWNVDKKSKKITDLIVVEFLGHPEEWPTHLYDEYEKDTGNCWRNWEEVNIYAEIIALCLFHKFENEVYEDKALEQFNKIDEFRENWKVSGSGLII
jgi:hypothetical protein